MIAEDYLQSAWFIFSHLVTVCGSRPWETQSWRDVGMEQDRESVQRGLKCCFGTQEGGSDQMHPKSSQVEDHVLDIFGQKSKCMYEQACFLNQQIASHRGL